MEELSATKMGPTDRIQFALRATSRGRSWTGFEANIFDTSGGLAQMSPKAHHSLVMHLGSPVNTAWRRGARVQHRRMTPGDFYIVPLGHSAEWKEDGPGTILRICMMPSLIRDAAHDLGVDPGGVSVASQLQLRDPGMEHIGWALQAELQGPEPCGRLYADCLGLALAARLLQRYAPVSPPVLGSISKRRLRTVIDYIHDNLAQDLSLNELAAVAGLSASHFKSLFKEAMSLPVHQFIIRCRVEYAMSLLTNSKVSLSEVASLSGFSDQSHMARCMRRVVGVTPAVVRRQHV